MKKLITLLILFVGMVSSASADGYTKFEVAGQKALTGAEKDWENGKITLTDEDGDGVYTYITTQSLEGNTDYKYKYILNDNWDTANASDRTFRVQATGSYKIIFSVNKSHADSYDNKYYACDTYAILQPTTVTFVGCGITSTKWASTETGFTKDGDSWKFEITETVDNVSFRFKIDDTEYQPHNGSADYTFNFTNGMTYDINTWSEYQGTAKAFILPSFSSTGYGKYVVWVTPYHNNMYMSVVAYDKVTTNAAGFCTYVNAHALNNYSGSGVTLYYATDNDNGNATAHAITNPAANTAMLVKGDASTDYYFEVATSGEAAGSNAFVAGDGNAVASTSGGKYNYILNGNTFYAANAKTVAVGKAYLQLSKAATARALVFDDEETTGIAVVKASQKMNGEFFNLAGQRVAQPAKGLYIVNGKKVIMK